MTLAPSDSKHDVIRWHCHAKLEKFNTPNGESTDGLTPYEVLERDGNLLVYGGASVLWHRLTGGTSVTAFDNTNANLGVGDSNTAAANTQTDLQAASNKLRKAMDATYPQHTDGTSSGNASVVFRSTFGSSDANFAWQEWALFNASSTGRMLNRKVESFGTKGSGTSWVLTITLTLA
jgi:hypothetical protein